MDLTTPPPVPLDKLKAILGNAKKVMKATDEKFSPKKQSQHISEGYSNSQNTNAHNYNEADEKEIQYETPDMSQYSSQTKQRDYTAEDIMNSNLPAIIKEAMLKKPIPKMSMSSSNFSLDDVKDLVDKPKFKSPGVPIHEGLEHNTYVPNSNLITIDKDTLNEMIENKVNAVLAQMFTKTITEQTIKKTIRLIDEGKIAIKKK